MNDIYLSFLVPYHIDMLSNKMNLTRHEQFTLIAFGLTSLTFLYYPPIQIYLMLINIWFALLHVFKLKNQATFILAAIILISASVMEQKGAPLDFKLALIFYGSLHVLDMRIDSEVVQEFATVLFVYTNVLVCKFMSGPHGTRGLVAA